MMASKRNRTGNPYGKGEEKGPTFTLADLCLGAGNRPPKPPCPHCDSGSKYSSDLPGCPGVCPACGRLLCDYA
jgi:hypothetical protein